ncbi:hypothetical protein DEU56DRAFT_784038 [Suillus clintonianus]|uniref:uncharacterized protein n=1 Tax=Suillus clintonianus TaxID=1904413 RepID=UPI001B8613D5|nr:uncharacterized protein DEU56DRAFT_784038 [Suillus clintonianus]KAG2148085.1 hypothetical protein DEU56DRAFT_784038 [Suillus clintonianus]
MPIPHLPHLAMFFTPTPRVHLPKLPLENMEALAANRLTWIAGYDVEKLDWVTFSGLDPDISEYDQDAWRNLVKSQRTQDLIQSIVDTTVCSGGSPELAQVRQGMNVLLQGSSGTGKKTAAYAICNILRRPMLSIYAHDIPYVSKVGPWAAKLASLAIKWNAVVFVERAYYFLRSSSPGLRARINIVLQEFESPGCICLWPSVLTNQQQKQLRPFFAAFNFPDLDRAARRQRWLQLFRKDESAATSSGSEDTLDSSSARDMESLTFLREIEKISWYKLDGTEIEEFMNWARDMAHYTGEDPSPYHLEASIKAMGVRLSLRRKFARFLALRAMDQLELPAKFSRTK